MKNISEYQCTMCENIYESEWTNEEAEKECVKNFGQEMAHGKDRAVICDDCYQKIRPDKHTELFEASKIEFFGKLI